MRRFLLLALSACSACATITVSPLFTDHAVLQRDRPVPVWGQAEAGETVTVTFHGAQVRAKADSRGHWQIQLPAMPAQAEGAELKVAGANTLVFQDVVVGEVWLCSGQSNMGFELSRAANAATEIPASANPMLREIIITEGPSPMPLDVAKASSWQVAGPQTSARFTAVGYFFGKELALKLKVPVGLIKSTVGGTPVEAWMSAEAFASDPAFAAVADRSRAEDQAMAELRRATWQKEETKASAAGAEAHAAFLQATPKPAVYPTKLPTVLFNGKIAPLKPYAFRGAIWYQGEANAARPQEYHALFAAMISGWRVYFGQGDFPFYWVQLPNFADKDATGTTWAFMREAQARTRSLAYTGQAVAIDVGEAGNLHPTRKEPVGHRLALIAGRDVYGFNDEASGPVFKSVERTGPALKVTFDHATGLRAEGGTVQSVQIAGADQVFHPAQAKIDGGWLTASAPEVTEPVAIRYAWTNAPAANLFNAAGLPALPFRSDSW